MKDKAEAALRAGSTEADVLAGVPDSLDWLAVNGGFYGVRFPAADWYSISRAVTAYGAECARAAEARGRAEGDAALKALRDLFGFVESGDLVRCTARDDEPGWAIRSMKLVMALKCAQELVGNAATAAPESLSVLADAGQGKQEGAVPRGTSGGEEG